MYAIVNANTIITFRKEIIMFYTSFENYLGGTLGGMLACIPLMIDCRGFHKWKLLAYVIAMVPLMPCPIIAVIYTCVVCLIYNITHNAENDNTPDSYQ